MTMERVPYSLIALIVMLILGIPGVSCSSNEVGVEFSIPDSGPTPAVPTLDLEPGEYFVPSDACEKMVSNDRALCSALVEELDLTDHSLPFPFQFISRKIDLNSDGREEYVTWIPSQGGTSGAPIHFFTRESNKLRRVFEEFAWTPIVVLNAKKKGWRDIAVQIAGGGVDPHFLVFRYDGHEYKEIYTTNEQPQGKVVIGEKWTQTVFGPMHSPE